MLQTCPATGETGQAKRLAAGMTHEERRTGPMRPVVVLLPSARDDRDAAMRVLASAAGPVPADHPAGQCSVMAMAGGVAPTGTTAADVAPARVLNRARPDGMPSAFPPAPLTEAESRVLRYLPTNLSAPEIAAELADQRRHRYHAGA